LQFEAVSQLPPDEQSIVKDVLDRLIIRYQTRRWRWDSAPAAAQFRDKSALQECWSTGQFIVDSMMIDLTPMNSHTRCLRFAVPVTRTPRKTRYRLLAKHYRAGFTPLSSMRNFKVVFLTTHPMRPGFAWRTET
jgi:hypothetical protein